MGRGLGIAAAGLLAVAPVAGAPVALAQVTVNPGALESLHRPAAPHAAPARRAPARRPAHPAPPHAAPAAPPAHAAPAKPPTVPTVPPAILALPPPVAVPLAHPPPVPPVPEATDAPGAATPLPNGVRVTFGADRSDLNPATEAALRAFAESMKANEATSINIYAYASGSTEDPSTPRRLSLARALAARAVLINDGIASPRIYPRALGATGGETDPDRVDLIAGNPSPPPAPAPASAPAPAAAAPPEPPAK